jgi:uncharacterized membrane protein
MPFSIRESLSFGWGKTEKYSGLLFRALLTLFALQVAQELVGKVLGDTLIGVLAALALCIMGAVLGIGFIRITLKIAKGQRTVKYADLLPPTALVCNYLLASLLAGLLIVLGLIFFIIPGIYLALRFSMVRFEILEGAGVFESLRNSAALTKGVKWKLLWFLIVCGILNALGMLFLMVGLLVTVPVTMLAYAHVYEKLRA